MTAWLSSFWARLGTPLSIFFVTRLGLILVAYLGLALVPVDPDSDWVADRTYPDNLMLEGWVHYDALWYFRIAASGYTNIPLEIERGGHRDTKFFPLYPLLMRWGGALTGDYYLAGMLISHFSFLVALMLLYELILGRAGEKAAGRTCVLLSVFPGGLFFAAVYTESLFLALTVAAFYFGERKQWHWAALSASLAAVTRIPGFLVGMALAVLYLEQIEWNLRKVRPDALLLALAAAFPAAHLYRLWSLFGDPLLFLHSHARFALDYQGAGHAAQALTPLSRLDTLLAGRYPAADLLQAVMMAWGLVSCSLAMFYGRRAWAVWGLANILIGVLAWHSGGRYVSVVFPAFLTWAVILPDRLFLAACYLSSVLLGLATVLFANRVWVG